MSTRASEASKNEPVDLLRWGRPSSSEWPDRSRARSAHGAALDQTVDKHLQHCLADLAQRFTIVGANDIDHTIVDGLRQIAELFELDRALLLKRPADGTGATASHAWMKPPQPATAELVQLASVPYIATKLDAASAVWFAAVSDAPDVRDREALVHSALRSAAIVPMTMTEMSLGARGAFAVGSTTAEHEWTPATLEQLRLVSGVFSQALARKAYLKALQGALDELHQLREDAVDETAQHRPAVKVFRASRLIVSESACVRRALAQVEQVAATPSTVLLSARPGAARKSSRRRFTI